MASGGSWPGRSKRRNPHLHNVQPRTHGTVEIRTVTCRAGWVSRQFVHCNGDGGSGWAGAEGAKVRPGRSLSSEHILTLAAGERFFSPDRLAIQTALGWTGWVTRKFVQRDTSPGGGGRAGAAGATIRSEPSLASNHIFALSAGERFELRA